LNHANQIIQIYNSILKNYSYPMGGKWTQDMLTKEVLAGQSYGAIIQDQVMGFLIYSPRGLDCDILLIGVALNHQHKGIMKSLLNYFVESTSFSNFYVEVHEKNEVAQIFYKKFGFREVGIRKNFYGFGHSAKLLAFERLI